MLIEATRNVDTITLKDVKQLSTFSKIYLIDIREPYEYDEMPPIPNSLLIPRGVLEFNIFNEVPNKDAVLIVYDKTSSSRAFLAANTLKKLGYAKTFVLEGGLDGIFHNR